ncbi:DUF4240 domain-containing protein [Streptomyces sp. CNQ085]|uniref:DUF4240 domain-containing protein n=1 Tax=Streptomyces sp. CNQ085 TaxID=2886944 RepID=UPI001F51111F|nr:DUF4240 domain-containing protein [Streptomyces sp. CNQ085]MCI0386033.1 DUF4240 domain-containing protein [Streptomyces sp. CNQ085]
MHETEFWELVDSTREAAGGDPADHAELLVDRLTLLDPDTVADFARHFEARVNRAWRRDVRGAARVLLGEADEDAFDSFRCWLVGQGRKVFEGALHDPDSLAHLLEDFDPGVDGEGGDIGGAADEAYERLTGLELPEPGLPEPPPEPEGAPPDFGDDRALAAAFPRLWERFGPPRG